MMLLQSEIDHQLFKKHRYAIIDRLAIDEFDIDFKYQVIAPAFVGSDTERCPLLVDLHELPHQKSVELLTKIHEQTTKGLVPWFCAFLSSTYEPNLMLSILKHRISTTLPDGNKRFLRFYDPAIAVHLPRCLDEMSQRWLFQKIDGLTFFLASHWCTLRFPFFKESLSENDLVFCLSKQSVQALSLLSLTNRAREQLPQKINHPDQWLSVCIAIENYFDIANRRFGLTQAEDWIAFAVHGCLWHPYFYEHPKILGFIQQADAQNTYADQTAVLSPDEWRQVSAELNNR
ncbi:MAG: DUF4123 domain-containing protein [Burkholderiales bacterium]|nr:DUF4123 domain-containing protein [Burkholderiales bacterium]